MLTAAVEPTRSVPDALPPVRPGTRRTRAFRRRRKLGLRLVRIELTAEVVTAMARAGGLAQGQEDDPAALAAAARTLITGALKGSSALGAPSAIAAEALEVKMWISPGGRDRLAEVGLLESAARDEPIAVASAVLSAAAQGLAFAGT